MAGADGLADFPPGKNTIFVMVKSKITGYTDIAVGDSNRLGVMTYGCILLTVFVQMALGYTYE